MSFSIFYIVQPPKYADFSVSLLASIRKYFASDVKVFGYCPEEQTHQIPEAVLDFHREMGAEIRPFSTANRWSDPYPHGNKILAALDDRGTDYSLFVDTDVVFARPIDWTDYANEATVTCSPATSISWGGDDEWSLIYGHCGVDLPTERINLLRRRQKHTFLPYFNAGMIGFPERTINGKRFAQTWYDTARAIDEMPNIDQKRPYLDQMSLPVAMRKSELTWRCLSEADQFILGGRIRGKPLPEIQIKAIHYRYPQFLDEIGAMEYALGPIRELAPRLFPDPMAQFRPYM